MINSICPNPKTVALNIDQSEGSLAPQELETVKCTLKHACKHACTTSVLQPTCALVEQRLPLLWPRGGEDIGQHEADGVEEVGLATAVSAHCSERWHRKKGRIVRQLGAVTSSD